jgi:hypothetical protein
MMNDTMLKSQFQTTEGTDETAAPDNCFVDGEGKVQCPTTYPPLTTASRAPAQASYSRTVVS